tara:strand:+ start:939 stop:1505 length:567 start_codon:yes stop_codon:yes gene_type:complete
MKDSMIAMEQVKIFDNFLDPYEFEEFKNKIFYPNEFGNIDMEWQALPHVNSPDDDDDCFQFVHLFYNEDTPSSNRIDYILPIVRKIPNLLSVLRVKANLLTKTPEHVFHGYHVDVGPAQGLPHKTAIFYCNTTNGWTQFEDGTKVEGIANRMVIFDGQLKHSSVSQTDEPFRVVVNFNYFEKAFIDET